MVMRDLNQIEDILSDIHLIREINSFFIIKYEGYAIDEKNKLLYLVTEFC